MIGYVVICPDGFDFYDIVVRLSVMLRNIPAHWKNSQDDRVEEQEETEGEGEKTEVEPNLREFTLTLSRWPSSPKS